MFKLTKISWKIDLRFFNHIYRNIVKRFYGSLKIGLLLENLNFDPSRPFWTTKMAQNRSKIDMSKISLLLSNYTNLDLSNCPKPSEEAIWAKFLYFHRNQRPKLVWYYERWTFNRNFKCWHLMTLKWPLNDSKFIGRNI